MHTYGGNLVTDSICLNLLQSKAYKPACKLLHVERQVFESHDSNETWVRNDHAKNELKMSIINKPSLTK